MLFMGGSLVGDDGIHFIDWIAIFETK